MNPTKTLTGSFTMPTEKGMDIEAVRLAKIWGADAIRDSDGTELSPELIGLGFDVFSTLALIRADQAWAKAHPDHCQQKYLMSDPVTATGNEVEIEVLKGFSSEQYQPDTRHDPKEWWEVIDRSSGELIPLNRWDYDSKKGIVRVRGTVAFHRYTVNFLVYQIWETTSMYNHITNGWTGEHQMSMDPRHPETRAHMLELVDKFIDSKPGIGWVRFTSMFYQFPIVSDEKYNTRFKDWCGYLDTISVLAMLEFEKHFGYRLRGEDFVTSGTYNTTKMPPTKRYLDWVAFVDEYVHQLTKECVARAHAKGKKAVLFFCDHWIGTEPYADNFDDMGFDAVVGPCINGRELRRIADVPGKTAKELRLYPYFFPVNLRNEPSFKEGGDPVRECKTFWMKIRRAMLRKAVDRIGFGGYLSLAVKYPDFIDYVARLANEFRLIKEHSGGKPPAMAPFRLSVLTAWGKTRPWMYDQTWPDGGIMEALTGFPFDIDFISFDDVIQGRIPAGTGVILCAGDAGTSWSGGQHWTDAEVQAKIREFVHKGGGFIGALEPTAHWHQGRFFQLSDVLGVERELGMTLDVKCNVTARVNKGHFILADVKQSLDLGRVKDGIYVCSPETEILAKDGNLVALAAGSYGKGRSVYFAGYKIGAANNRVLLRSIFWAAGKETEMEKWFSSNPNTECAHFPAKGATIVINNSDERQKTVCKLGNGKSVELELEPNESRWL